MSLKHLTRPVLFMLELMLCVAAMAHDIEQDGIYYNIKGDSAIVTSGYYPYSGDVTIPAAITHHGDICPVKAIGPAAFRDCSALTSVTIPRSITAVGEHAFAGCTALDSVEISDLAAWCGIDFSSETANPCHHGHRLFLNGEEITQLVIPDSVTAINSFAFSGCSSLSSVSIPSAVMFIGPSAFSDCSSLTAIMVDNGNPSYDSRDNCNAIIETATGILIVGCQNSVIPNTVTAIGNWAFYACTGLTGIFIPNSVTIIGFEAFYHCSSLQGINIPNSVTTIGYQAFYGCSALRSIHIPASVRVIGTSAFEFCPSLCSMSVAADNPRYDSRDECNAIIETRDSTLIAGCCNTVIPATVKTIGDYAFSGCSTLTGIDIPGGVTAVGDYAFRGCSALRTVSIPDGVTTIGASAFFECAALSRVDIPASVEFIGGFAFERCPVIMGMTVASGNPTYDSRDSCNAIIETTTNTLVAGCMNTVIPATVTAIGDNAFSGSFMLTGVSIPRSVTTIGHYAFMGCTSLANIIIPNTVRAIGDAAFSDCSALTRLDIPNSVTAIGQAAFGGCSSLEHISLPKSMTSIGNYEFFGCTLLKDIKIPNTVNSIGASAFRGCLSLTAISIPKSTTEIGSSAFRECPSLASITVATGNPVYDSRQGCNAIIETATGTLIAGCRNTVIPSDVTTIGYAAFDGCVLLTDITIPNSVTVIARKAFHNCPALKDVTCLIPDPSMVTTAKDAFTLPSGDYASRTLHVPIVAVPAYQHDTLWSDHFNNITAVNTPVDN
ncbi:MAG: leucine-rich repeat domain-containing protein [Muribaculaceae bacterium]|nr:leucine-rich repeat domain-containing protein [Muribaculaceae bacterium]